ncbi:MAG: hypothetical protein K5925_00055 [Bacilli bacterium]|nr:hypothetical protein [Bacilli bacterium]
MKENAIIVRWLDTIKIHVDFDNFYDSVCSVINADRLSTVHTTGTKRLSSLLGVHLIGFVNRDGNDINNDRACELTDYDYLGSMLFLCKTDDNLNPLPFNEDELEKVYNYLTNGLDKADRLIPYILRYHVTAKWPNNFDDHVDYDLAYPLFDCGDDPINCDHFDGLLDIKSFDFNEEAASLLVRLGEKEYKISPKVGGEAINIEFDYFRDPEIETTRRVGTISIWLEKHEIDMDDGIKGVLVIEEETRLDPPGEFPPVITEVGEIIDPNPNDDDRDNSVTFENTINYFYLWFISEEHDFALGAFKYYYEDENDMTAPTNKFFIPIYLNKETKYMSNMSYEEDGQKKTLFQVYTYKLIKDE